MNGSIKRSSLRYAFKRSIPIMIGFFPVGIAYGILMLEAGYGFLWSAGCSAIVFAGSLQMLMVSFLAGGVPILTVAVTALLLNSRHIFYGISFIEKFRDYGPWKYFLIFSLADENYSLLCSPNDMEGTDERLVNIYSSLLVYGYWIVFSALGGICGRFITFDTTGIDFALTALFTVILIEQLKGTKSKLPAVMAAVCAVLCILIFGASNFLLPSLTATVAVLMLLRPMFEGREAAK